MINKTFKKTILLIALTLLLIGIVSATETNTTNTDTTTITTTNTETLTNTATNTITKEDNKEIKKTNTIPNTKTSTTKTPSKITINKINPTEYTDKTLITGKLTDNKNNPLKNSVIKININGKTIGTTKTKTNGTYTYQYTTNKIGTNYLTILYPGDNNYRYNTSKKTFKVDKKGTRIKLNIINNTEYKDYTLITGKFTDNNNKPLKNTNINLKINKIKYTAKTDTNGIYSYKYRTTKVGTNTITAYFPGNNYYKYNTTKKTFKVNKKALIIDISGQSREYSPSDYITGSVYGYDYYSPGVLPITININGKQYNTKTDKEGLFNYKYAINKMGLNNIIVSYKGNSVYQSTSVKTSYYIKPVDTIISLTPVYSLDTVNGYRTLKGKFTDTNGNPLKNSQLTLNKDGKISKIKTDNNGKFSYTYKGKEYYDEIITVSFAGNERYAGTTTTTGGSAFESELHLDTIYEQILGETVTISGYLKDTNRGYTSYQTPLTITLNGKSFTIKTSSDYSKDAYFKYTFKATKPGLNTLTVSFKGNKFLNKAVNKTTFYVTKKPTYISVSDSSKTTDKKYTKIKGVVFDNKGNMLKNVPLTLKIDGKKYTAKTNTKGAFNYYFKNNNFNKHSLYVIYDGNSKYEASTESIIFNSRNKEGEIEAETPLSTVTDYLIYDGNYDTEYMGTERVIGWYQVSEGDYPTGVYIMHYGRMDHVGGGMTNKITSVKFYFKNKKDQTIITRTGYTYLYDYMYSTDLIEGYTPYKAVVKFRQKTPKEIQKTITY